MIRSMTGFGKATGEYNGKKFTVELRSLNSKGFDLTVKMASVYREKELDLRNELSRDLERGKIDLSIFFENAGTDSDLAINREILFAYYRELKAIRNEMGGAEPDYLSILLRIPDVLQVQREEPDQAEWDYILQLVGIAKEQFNSFRTQEGAVLARELEQRITLILGNLEKAELLADERKPLIKARLLKALEELGDKVEADQNRFEQELLYYLEKLDITEERVRLRAHCSYFLETMHQKGNDGKKLGFIAQEIGREINTIGSKSNDAEIQRYVVQMKDELEKIKEQVLNVL